MYPPETVELFDHARERILKDWEDHKKSPQCTGKRCPICKEFKEDYDLARPLD